MKTNKLNLIIQRATILLTSMMLLLMCTTRVNYENYRGEQSDGSIDGTAGSIDVQCFAGAAPAKVRFAAFEPGLATYNRGIKLFLDRTCKRCHNGDPTLDENRGIDLTTYEGTYPHRQQVVNLVQADHQASGQPYDAQVKLMFLDWADKKYIKDPTDTGGAAEAIENPASEEDTISYNPHIAAFLESNCLQCHGKPSLINGLDFADTAVVEANADKMFTQMKENHQRLYSEQELELFAKWQENGYSMAGEPLGGVQPGQKPAAPGAKENCL